MRMLFYFNGVLVILGGNPIARTRSSGGGAVLGWGGGIYAGGMGIGRKVGTGVGNVCRGGGGCDSGIRGTGSDIRSDAVGRFNIEGGGS